ncbi:MAG: ketoacyl-ACP synthase III [Lachnospiraceae bacterium]|nr:ketoacyl-ACP synthase III [Lachnospiraceae bacterium]
MTGVFHDITIKGISTCVPERVIENSIYAQQFGEKRVSKHMRMTGVHRRHKLSENQKASDLAEAAANNLFDKLSWQGSQIDVLVYVTQSPDLDKPATAFVLQKRLGIKKESIVFDVNLGCSAFVMGVQIVSALLRQKGSRGLLLISDGVYGEERQNAVDEMLFGDAGCAVALENNGENEIAYTQYSDGTRYEAIHKEKSGKGVMDGNAVFAFTLNDVTDSIKDSFSEFKISDEEVDYYFLHQGQKMILDNLIDLCEIPSEKVLFSIHDYGNTGGASIPVTMCAHCDKLAEKDRIRAYMCGFGVGLSWGSIYTCIETKNIFPIQIL